MPVYNSVVEFIDRTGCGPVQGFEEDVASGLNLYLLQIGSHGVVRHFRVVVLLREMAEPHVPQPGMPVLLQQLPAGVVALVSARAQDTLFEIGRIGSVEQHMLVVVRLYHKVVRRADVFLHLLVDAAAVGHEHKALSAIVNAVPDAVGRVMLDAERVDFQPVQVPLFALVEETSAGAQFLAHAVVAVDTRVNLRRGVDRQFDPLAQGAYGTDMVRVVVRDEHAHDVPELQTHLVQVFLNGTGRDTRIDENTPPMRAQIIAVAAASAGKTPEYKPVFVHFTKSAAKVLKKIDICK